MAKEEDELENFKKRVSIEEPNKVKKPKTVAGIKITDYNLALTEVSEILKQLGKEYTDKIPQEVLELIEKNKYKNSNFKFDINKKIADQEIHDETLEVLAYLNCNYWLEGNEKNNYEKLLQENYYKIEDEKRKKYNPEDVFKKNRNSSQELQIQVTKTSIWSKIIKKISGLIKK